VGVKKLKRSGVWQQSELLFCICLHLFTNFIWSDCRSGLSSFH
jgi:hypothetical protein